MSALQLDSATIVDDRHPAAVAIVDEDLVPDPGDTEKYAEV